MRRLSVLRALAAFALIGCSNSDHLVNVELPATSPNVIGTFALTSSNGVAPPFTVITTATEQWRLLADALVIAADGTWSETSTYRVFAVNNGVTIITDSTLVRQLVVSGHYDIANGEINFFMTAGGTGNFVGSVSGDALIIVFEGKRFGYSR